MTQSSCKRDTKSKSHPSMKLAPVRVFSPPSHEIKRHTIEIHGGHEEGCCPGMGLSLNRPAPTNGIAVFRKKKYPASKHFNYGERSKKPGNTGASGEASRAEERDSFLSPPLAVASPLAWLLATPPNGELARRLEKVTKAMQIPRGGGMGSHYDISSRAVESLRLSKISDDFPKMPKCPQISVPKAFEHFRGYFRWFLSKRT